MKTFKEYILATYEQDELKDIAEHGCASCAPGGMIYYTETTDLYNTYKESLHEILGEYMDNTIGTPSAIIESLNDFTQFANAMVWLCTELIAYEVTENENN
jgi:trehalose-6-phosphatase